MGFTPTLISQQPKTPEEIVVSKQEGESKESETPLLAEVEGNVSAIRDVPKELPETAATTAAAASAITVSLPIPIRQAAHSYNLRETGSNW